MTTRAMKKKLKTILHRLRLFEPAFHLYCYFRSIKFLYRNFPYFKLGAPDGLRLPPLNLITLVTGNPNIPEFLETGKLAADSIAFTLSKNGVEIKRLESILDFGCGCGRVIRHWKDLTDTRIYGTDYNKKLIRWCRRQLTFADFQMNRLHPPLSFQPEELEFIYALSVFTHMPEELQRLWMTELHRILKPGGHLMLTTHGEYYLGQLTPGERRIFEQGDLIVREEGEPGSNRYSAYHPRVFVTARLANEFELVDFIQQGAKGNPYQDLFLLKKPMR